MVIVDICGTLYDSNTTFDFLDYYVRTRGYRQFRAAFADNGMENR